MMMMMMIMYMVLSNGESSDNILRKIDNKVIQVEKEIY